MICLATINERLFELFNVSFHHFEEDQMRILIAEKDPVGRRLLEQMMRMEGYEVFMLDRNKQTKILINEIRPDIVLMNVFNPLQSGTEPLDQIKIRCNEGLDPVIYVNCMGPCDGLDFMADINDSTYSPFDRLPSRLKMHIVDNIQRLCIALRQLKRWAGKGISCSLEKTFSMDELESYSLMRTMQCL
jgi:response regulator RpfG family c-di-GMP phosphodiesterase